MKPKDLFQRGLFVTVFVFAAAIASAASKIDVDDHQGAVGREDDVRVYAWLLDDRVASGSPVAVTYQVENLTSSAIALADRVSSVSFDPETRTVTMSIGCEVPNASMPHMSVISSGQKKTFTSSAKLHIVNTFPTEHSPLPRYVQIKVSVLRDLVPFQALLERAETSRSVTIPDSLFDSWLENNGTILLNAIPVRYDIASAAPLGSKMSTAADR